MVSPVERVSVAAIAVAAGFAVASAALAQGGPQKTYNWSGLYAGVGGGMAGISFDEAISRQLEVMDATAFTLCRDQKLPIKVFSIFKPDGLRRVILGEDEGTLVHA